MKYDELLLWFIMKVSLLIKNMSQKDKIEILVLTLYYSFAISIYM